MTLTTINLRGAVVAALALCVACGSGGDAASRPDASPDAGFTRPCPRPATPRELAWTAGHYFPKFPASSHMLVLHVKTALHDNATSWVRDWRISDSPETMAALTLVGMQGTINRETPCVYLDWYDPLSAAGQYWIPKVAAHITVEDSATTGAAAVAFLYQRFSDRFAGAVIYDPQIPDTINVATMLAGLEDRVILAPQQVGQAGIPDFSSVTDLRSLAAQQGWDATEAGKLKLYQWVYDNLWPRLEKRFVGVASPGPPTSVQIDGASNYYPLGIAGRDYLVALRAPALWLAPNDTAQAALLDRFLDDAPSPIPVAGAYGNDEVATTKLISRHGDWDAVMDWPNAPLAGGNVTALAGIDVPVMAYPAAIDADRILATLGTAPVTALFTSDGDNLEYQLDRGFHGDNGFAWSDVQGHRFSWTTNSTLAELAPLVWNDYLGSADEVGFLDGFSGAGFMYPSHMSATQLAAYLDRAATYHAASGIRSVWIDDRDNAQWPAIAPAYHAKLKGSGFLGAILGGGSGVAWGFAARYGGAPTPGLVPAYVVPASTAAQVVADLPGRRVGDIPIRIYDYQHFARLGVPVDDATAPGGHAVKFPATIDSPQLVFGTPPLTLLPGVYTLSLRVKVAQNVAAAEVASFYVGTQTPSDFHELGRRRLHASEFAQAREWQTFDFTFTLDAITSDVTLRIEVIPGTTDFYADVLDARRAGADPLPTYAPILISLVAPGPKLPLAGLADQLAAAGVVVLTVDELIASLNPEFMIAFAEPRLGKDHAALVQARALLAGGKFLDALLSVRGALAPTRQ